MGSMLARADDPNPNERPVAAVGTHDDTRETRSRRRPFPLDAIAVVDGVEGM